MSTQHGTANGSSLEAALNAEANLNIYDLEAFLCLIMDGDIIRVELGGNINERLIKGLTDFLEKLKDEQGKTAIFSYTNTPKPTLTEVASDLF